MQPGTGTDGAYRSGAQHRIMALHPDQPLPTHSSTRTADKTCAEPAPNDVPDPIVITPTDALVRITALILDR